MQTRRIMSTILGLSATVALLAGCTGEKVSAEGTWGTGSEGTPQLVLEEGGALTGTDGCNQLVGSWELTDETTVTFIQVASTMMFCEDVDTWLATLDTGVLDGGILHIHDADGTEIGTLARVPSE